MMSVAGTEIMSPSESALQCPWHLETPPLPVAVTRSRQGLSKSRGPGHYRALATCRLATRLRCLWDLRLKFNFSLKLTAPLAALNSLTPLEVHWTRRPSR